MEPQERQHKWSMFQVRGWGSLRIIYMHTEINKRYKVVLEIIQGIGIKLQKGKMNEKQMLWDSKQDFLDKKGGYYGSKNKKQGQLPCHQAPCLRSLSRRQEKQCHWAEQVSDEWRGRKHSVKRWTLQKTLLMTDHEFHRAEWEGFESYVWIETES